MSRPKKNTADYFGHDASHSRELRMICRRFGNDGYAVYFRLFEDLARQDGHVLDLSDSLDFEFTESEYLLEPGELEPILETMAKYKIIDAELWAKGFVWSDTFIEKVEPLYTKRKAETPEKPGKPGIIPTETEFLEEKPPIIPTETPQEKESKVKNRKGEESTEKENTPQTPQGDTTTKKNEGPLKPKRKVFKPPELEEVKIYFHTTGTEKGYLPDQLREMAEQFFDFYEAKGWVVGKSKMKKWTAAANNWIRNQKNFNNGNEKPNSGNPGGGRPNKPIDYAARRDAILKYMPK